MGRYKLPTKIKEMHGTLEKSRVLGNEVEYQSLNVIPVPPETLNEFGQQVWYRQLEQIQAKGLLFVTDIDNLEGYCIAAQHHREAAIKLKDKLVVKNPKENHKPMLNPWFKILNESRQVMIKYSAMFGFSPAHKTSIAIHGVEGGEMSLLK